MTNKFISYDIALIRLHPLYDCDVSDQKSLFFYQNKGSVGVFDYEQVVACTKQTSHKNIKRQKSVNRNKQRT